MAHRLHATTHRTATRALLPLGLMLVLVAGAAPGSTTGAAPYAAVVVRPPVAVVRSSATLRAGALVGTSITGSPFRGSGVRARVTLTMVLAEAAEVTVRVFDYDGNTMRTILDRRPREPGTYPITWDGRNGRGRRVPDGPYRMRATVRAPSGDASVEHWVTKAPDAPYPLLPGAIVVAINPGHGGSDPGAVRAGTRERSLNLDIARRLRRMLEASGITVVMTRTGDRDVNRPAIDRNGNGRINHTDELIARNDIGNLARADLMLNIHNNATECRCGAGTEMFINRHRPWSAESRRLARAVQAAHVRRLQAFESSAWKVIDRGIGSGDYMSLRPATRHARRPSLMPAILGESLYLDRRRERARLRDPDVRTALAAAYFEGVTAWLATRPYSVRYTDIDVPDRLPASGDGTVRLRIHNTGTRSSSSWRLVARVVPRVAFYDGSGTPGTLVGTLSLPDGIAPGASVDVELGITMPATARQWLLKLDVARPAGRLSDRGVVQPQLRIVTDPPAVSPMPSAGPAQELLSAPTIEPTPAPTTEPTLEPTAEPTLEPTPAPATERSPQPSPEPTTEPTPASTPEPTTEPTAEPTAEPTPQPIPAPTAEPSIGSEPEPSGP